MADLGTVLDEARIVIEPALREAGISLVWEVGDGLPLVQADHHSLLQVFVNLARNSMQALEGRPVREVRISAAVESDLVVVRFRDSGPGVARPRNSSGRFRRARIPSAWDSTSPARSCARTAAACATIPKTAAVALQWSCGRWRIRWKGDASDRTSQQADPRAAGRRPRAIPRERRARSDADPNLTRRALRQHSRGADATLAAVLRPGAAGPRSGRERASQFLPAARQIGYEGRVLVVTAWVSDTEARRLMRQGVTGIFLKQGALSELAGAIRTVAAGGTWFDRSFAAIGEDPGASPQAAAPVFNDRQRKVLRFVLEGLSNKEIAWRLQISESYVKAILQSLFQKTGVRTRGQLVRVAVEQYEDQL